MFITFTLRRLLRHWRLNLLVLSGLTLTAALVAGLPMYATAIAARSLHQALDAAPAFSRNISMVSEGNILNASLAKLVDETLGDLILKRIDVRSAMLNGDIPAHATKANAPINAVQLWAFNELDEHVNIIAGRFPNHIEPSGGAAGMFQAIQLEAVIGVRAQEQTGLEIGQTITATAGIAEYHIKITGIVEPVDLAGDYWMRDPSPFIMDIVPISNDEDFLTLSAFLPPSSMFSHFPGHDRSWRFTIDQTQLHPDTVEDAQARITNLQVNFNPYDVEISTALPKMIEDYQAHLAITRMALFLLTSQAMLFVLYTLGMISSFMLERSQSELAAMASRGANRRQIVSVFALEGLLLALPAGALFGPLFARQGLDLWAKITGAILPSNIPAESWVLALVAVGFGWLALVLPVISAAGRTLLEWQKKRARPATQAGWQRGYFDVFLLVLGGLAYWQLTQTGSFVMGRFGDTALADPMLLIGPSVLLIAVALFLLRVFPLLLQWVAQSARQVRGLVLPLGLAKLARDPVGPSRVVLLITLTAGLTLFAKTFGDSLDVRQTEMAQYLSGADLRVTVGRLEFDAIRDMPGVEVLSPMYRTRLPNSEGRFDILVAVDPNTLGQVTQYPSGISPASIADLIRVLEAPTESGDPPAIFSANALPPQKGIGDRMSYTFARQVFNFEIRGIIAEFPAASGRFFLSNMHDVGDWDTLTSLNISSAEAWLATTPDLHEGLAAELDASETILGDARTMLAAFKSDALSEGSKRAFELNALILGVLSIAGFLLVQYFSAQQRSFEFSLLRASGLSTGQLLRLISTEGLLVVGLGLVSGTIVGAGLAQVMRPFLSRLFRDALGGGAVNRIVTDWLGIGRLYGVLVGFYALALLILIILLLRVGIHRAMRIGED